MNENSIFHVPFLRTSRHFPTDAKRLEIELNSSYIEIAGAVNVRTVGIFTSNFPSITGETWYQTPENSSFPTNKQQTLRKIYTFGAIVPGTELDIPVGFSDFVAFTRIYGTVITNAIDYRPVPFTSTVNINQNIALLVGTVIGVLSIRIIVGAGSPAITSGIVVLEFLTNV